MLPFFLALLNEETDRRLFEQIYMNHRKQMFAVARSYLQNDADAEDAVHDVFLRVASSCWDTVRKIENEADLRAYLLKAVKYTSLNVLDRRARRDLSLEDAVFEQDPPDRTEDETFASVCADMDEERLLAAIERLPEIYRDALYFRFVLQFSAAETARAMGQSLAATKKQIQRGKQKLLALLREDKNYE